MENKKEYAYNLHGVKVVKCCASCEFRCPDAGHATKTPRRLCLNGRGTHYLNYLCRDWKMEETSRRDKPIISLWSMQPRGDGRVKRPDYIKFMQQKLEALDKELNASGMPSKECGKLQRDRVHEWICEFEMTRGSRFL